MTYANFTYKKNNIGVRSELENGIAIVYLLLIGIFRDDFGKNHYLVDSAVVFNIILALSVWIINILVKFKVNSRMIMAVERLSAGMGFVGLICSTCYVFYHFKIPTNFMEVMTYLNSIYMIYDIIKVIVTPEKDEVVNKNKENTTVKEIEPLKEEKYEPTLTNIKEETLSEEFDEEFEEDFVDDEFEEID